jgi:hypothetical protein
MSNPPAGWYDNPEGEGKRYWDGASWTRQFQHGVDEQARANEHAVGLSVLFGVISYVGLLVALNPHIAGSSSYGAGRLLAPVVAASTVVALVTRGMGRHLGWWVYALVVPVASGAVALVMNAGALMGS